MSNVRLVLALVVWMCCAAAADAQSQDALAVGHWIEARGKLVAERRFEAESLEVLEPADNHVLIGTVERVDAERERFFVLGQEVHVSDKTKWQELTLGGLAGKRVKVEGHYRGARNFSARTIAPRGAGRDRLSGRIDALQRTEAGLELTVIGFTVVLPGTARFENTADFRGLALAPAVEFETASGILDTGDEDIIQGTLRLGTDLWFGGQLEYKGERERNFDLDDTSDADETKQRASFRAQLVWTPADHVRLLASPRFELEDRREDGGGPDESTAKPHVNELFVEVDDLLGTGVGLHAGRQRFDDGREWIYKKNLDAIRLTRDWEFARLEVSWSTLVDDGSDRDKHTHNWIAYLSNGDELRHLALYVVDRRDDRSPRDFPIHFGARAVGEFIPRVKSWAEFSVLRGFSNDVNLRGYGFDVGATWKLDPLRLTLGYASGSGDRNSSTGVDESFRQTGLQRNNDKAGGATSVRYYGELVDPALTNLSVLTLGVGVELARKTTLEVLWHQYTQHELDDAWDDTNLNQDPSGLSRDLGRELDLVLGSKALSGWEFEFVLGRFEPGRAFPGADDAWLAAFQLRFGF